MRVIKIVFFILLIPSMLWAQGNYYDSLKQELQKTTNDTLKMDIYRNLGFYLQNGKVDSAYYFHQQQLAYAKKLNMKLYIADAYQQIGYTLLWNSEFPDALKNYNKALKIASDPNAETIGWGYQNFSFSESPEDARLSIVGMVHFELATLYGASRLYGKQRKEVMKSHEMGKKLNNRKILSLTFGELGNLAIQEGHDDSALMYFQKSIFYYKDSPYLTGLGNNYEAIGNYYVSRQQYDSALAYFRKGGEVIIATNDLISLSLIYRALGRVFMITNQSDSALFYTLKDIEVAKTINNDFNLALGYSQLSEIYEKDNKPILALEALKESKVRGDSIYEVYIKKLIQFQNDGFENELKLKKIEEEQAELENQVKMIGLISVIGIVLVVAIILYRNNLKRKQSNALLRQQKQEIQTTLDKLESTQAQLIHAEKMASLGELTAGIAHEIQNPLNFVNNFSDVSSEMIDEMKEELQKKDIDEASTIADDLKQNLEKINHHGKRASEIVKSMLQHSRTGSGEKELTDINVLCDEYLRLSYHGLRAKDKSFNAEFKLETEPDLPKLDVVPQDIGRVLLNLINNAFQAVAGVDKPKVTVSTKYLPLDRIVGSPSKGGIPLQGGVGGGLQITISDNGPGIPDDIKDKIFQPFFTTKPTGEGTGLGLSMSYDIVTKGHGGMISFSSERNKGTKFKVLVPLYNQLKNENSK